VLQDLTNATKELRQNPLLIVEWYCYRKSECGAYAFFRPLK